MKVLYLDPAIYGNIAQRGQENNYLLTVDGPYLLMRVKVGDKLSALVRYERRTVQGRAAFVPTGARQIPWDTSGDLRSIVAAVMEFAKYAGYIAMGPAVVALTAAVAAGTVTLELLKPFAGRVVSLAINYYRD